MRPVSGFAATGAVICEQSGREGSVTSCPTEWFGIDLNEWPDSKAEMKNICISLFLLLSPLTLSAGDRVDSLLTNVSGSPSQGYPSISEAKRGLILRLRKSLCHIAGSNNFFGVKEILKNAGKRYVGEEITVEAAYPHIYCNEMMAANIDLIRVAVESPHLELFWVNLVYHFVEGDASNAGKTMFVRLPMCKRDFGYGCLDVFEHIEKNRRILSNAVSTGQYNFLEKVLRKGLSRIGGPIRDAAFCREVLDEPLHCQ